MSSAAAARQPSLFTIWWLAFRPKTLVAAVVPVAVGAAVAQQHGGFALLPTLACLVGALLIQIGTNLANDAFDFEKGADTEERLGPTRAVQAGILTSRQVKLATAVVFAMAVGVGLYLSTVGGWPIVALGVVSIASGVAYTAGPYPLAYVGLGELFVMIFFGFAAVCGTAFIQLGLVPEGSIWCGAGVGAVSTALIVVNNLRDRETDARSGKMTLIARFGRGFGLAEYAASVAVAYLVPVVLIARELAPLTVMGVFLTLPLAVQATHGVWTREGRDLNASLGDTARLLVMYGVTLALGVAF